MTAIKITPVEVLETVRVTPASVTAHLHHRTKISITVGPVVTTGVVHLRQSRHFRLVVGKRTTSTTGAGKLHQNKANLFKHFAHYDAGGVDPALALVAGATKGVAAYDTSTPSNFRRVSAAVVVPNDYPVSDGYAWRRATFVGVGARVASMATGNYAMLDAAQVELAKNGTTAPSAYAPARSLVCNVRPNRLNYATNPKAKNTTSSWASDFATTNSVITGSGCPDADTAVRFTYTAAATNANGYLMAFNNHAGSGGTPWSTSIWARSSRATTGYLAFYNYTSTGTNIGKVTGPTVTLPANTWVRLTYNGFQPSPNTDRLLTAVFMNGSTAVNDTLDLTAVVIEPASTAGPYFDGDSGSEYLWQQGMTPNAGASFYYQNYLSRSYLLRQILAENSPLGTTPAVPQFGILPLT